jgi:crotonobetainyl-CoA:carnitine CoA-transferase CaiB-like acyl-CoA transferase
MNDVEFAQYEAKQAAAKVEAKAEAKAEADKVAILERIGLTADELKTILG